MKTNKEETNMKKDMFYKSGEPNIYDGRCANCPFSNTLDGICTETEYDVTILIRNGKININCPYISKEELK